jgi:hypothetical protein
MTLPDVIVIGSGITGAMAAETLIDGGARVAMVDVGLNDSKYGHLIPNTDFISIRKTEEDQHRYFLGDSFEGIPHAVVSTGAQLTPPRNHVRALVDSLLPVASKTFRPQESLAYGGLGSAWGGGTCVYSDDELDRAGLNRTAMRIGYQVVADRIGISGADDDARAYTWDGLTGIEPPPPLDETCSRLASAYARKREDLNVRGIRLGRTALALITSDRGGRKAYRSLDMDFYADTDKSVYRPWFTVDDLRRDPRFEYVDSRLALRFSEDADGVEVDCLDTRDGSRVRHRARRLVLAAGTLGTARIVLRSGGDLGRTLPLLCNPYTYVPCLQPSMVGKDLAAHRMSLGQLSMFHDPDGTNRDVAMGSIYSYRSLMLFRILRQAPIDMVDARLLMQYLQPGITIVGIHHPESPGSGRSLRIAPDESSPTGDRLEASYLLSDDETRRLRNRETTMIRALRSMGCWAIKRIDPGMGASIHYAGTLPFGSSNEPLTLSAEGRLAGTSAVWIADGSGFRYLPAKGLTLSLMANAHVVAQAVLRT